MGKLTKIHTNSAKYFVDSNEMFVGATCSCITL